MQNPTLTGQIVKMVKAKTTRDRTFMIVGILASIVLALLCIQLFTDLVVEVLVKIPSETIQYNSSDDIIAQLTSMQANTLAIVSIFLTAAATILGFLGINQWLQARKLQTQYEDMNHRVQNLFSLAVVQALSEEQYYVRANMVLAEELERLRNTSNADDGAVLFSSIQMLLATEKEATIASKVEAFTETEKGAWESVADLCTQILKIPYTYAAVRYLIQIKYIYAEWQLCRITRQTDRKQSLKYINAAHQMLQKISESEMDPYGHIYNLRGLVLLWRSKCQEDNSSYKTISTYAQQYRKAAVLFERAIDEAKMMSPKGDHSVFQNHLGAAQINVVRCIFFDYKTRENNYSNWDKEMRDSLLQAARTYCTLVETDNDYGKAYLNLASICCYCVRYALEDRSVRVFHLSDLFHQGKEIDCLFMNAQRLLRCALIKGVTLPDVGYKMFEIVAIEQAASTSPKKQSFIPIKSFLQEMNDITNAVIKMSNISDMNLQCKKLSAGNIIEYQSLTDKDEYQKVDDFLASILIYYHVISNEYSEPIRSLQNVQLASDTPVIGFLEPWRNYAYWRFETSENEDKAKWKGAAIELNKRLKNHRKLQAESWEKSIARQ